jgi:hypothetical protein
MQILVVVLLLTVCQTFAQTCNSTEITTSPNGTCPCPDVFLDVPTLRMYLVIAKIANNSRRWTN